MTIAALATLGAGIVFGYLGQRSRMCFMGAIRDFFLNRDTYLLKGFITFGITAWLAFPLFRLLGGEGGPGSVVRLFELSPLTVGAAILAVIGGLGVGVFSTLANGCPFRQHVMAAQGAVSSVAYLAGFYLGAIFFHWLVVPMIGPLL